MALEKSTLLGIDVDLPNGYSGKVRESWPIAANRRILVTTDRLSSFDKVIGAVEHKGQVLNQLSAWWFKETEDIVANHLVAVPDPNVSIVTDVTPLPVEIVLRSRLTGSTSTSMLPRYLAGERSLYGYELPDGLTPHCSLPEIMLTPTSKAKDGEHDEPTTASEILASGLVEEKLWSQVTEVAFKLFERGMKKASDQGFILADTKYEFGLSAENELLLIDEVHTPDCSRYWLASSLQERLSLNMQPENFDKEPVRLAFKEIGYAGEGDPPKVSDEIWNSASKRYVSLFEALTGQQFVPGARPIEERISKALVPYTTTSFGE